MIRVIALLGLSLAIAAPASAQRAPYLQQLGPSGVTVVWQTASSGDSVVCYGDAIGTLSNRAMGAASRNHVVALSGLSASSTYFYAVSGNGACPPAGGGDADEHFTTAPPVGSRVPFRIWTVGDSGSGSSNQRGVLTGMQTVTAGAPPDLFLHLGDMAYNTGQESEFTENFFEVYEAVLLSVPVWPTLGNHEAMSASGAPYYAAYVLPTAGEVGGLGSGTEAYYSFDYANAHFIVLDSEVVRGTNSTMQGWLRADLEATTQDWIIAFFHHPPYTHGTHNSDIEIRHREMRMNILPILEDHGVDLVLAGHSHDYERSYLVGGSYESGASSASHILDLGDGRVDGDGAYDLTDEGALYVVGGHGGASANGGTNDHPLMYYSEQQYGSLLIDVDGFTLTLRAIRTTGVEADQVTLMKEEITDPSVRFLSPEEGDVFRAGSSVDVMWTSFETSGAVRLEYSLDGGTVWSDIVASTPDDGHHAWTTPATTTTMARVRITDPANAAITDTSGNFTLTLDPIPDGGVVPRRDGGRGDGAIPRDGGPDMEGGGCGCRVEGRAPSSHSAILGFFTLALLAVRKRSR